MERLTTNNINAFWYNQKDFKYKYINFGDQLTQYILKFLIQSENVNYTITKKPNRIISLGSLLGNNIKIYESDVIWGTGGMYEKSDFYKKLDKNIKICAVRGPKTRKVLLDYEIKNVPEIYGDPGILTPCIFRKLNIKREIKYKYGIILHMIDNHKYYDKIYNAVKNIDGIKFINIQDDVTNVIKQINQCEYIFSSALHGLIVAEAYKIPAIWFECSDAVQGNGFKFYDYYLGTGRSENDIVRLDWRNNVNLDITKLTPKPIYKVKEFLDSFPYKINKHAYDYCMNYFKSF